MGRPKEWMNEALAQEALRQMRVLPDHRLHLRLLAISRCAEHSISEVAGFFRVSRNTLTRWIRKFRSEGVDGLEDKPKGHRPAKLGKAELKVVRRWLQRGDDVQGQPKHWTLEELRRAIRSRFGIEISLMPLWRHVHALGFRQKVPRPHHAQAAPEAQRTFKKNG